MNTTKTKKFDAVAESRRWKAAVSSATEGMTRDQLLAFFNRDRVLAALGASQRMDEAACVVREEPPAAP